MKLYCCGCNADISPRLTDGREVYPHRSDLAALPFWRCDTCRNFVGCHHKTDDRTRPLGCIPTAEIKAARQKIHRTIDPLWKGGRFTRRKLYALISEKIGAEYHTAEIRSVEEAERVLRATQEIAGSRP